MTNIANNKKTTAKTGQQAESSQQDPMLMKLFHDELKDIYWAEKHLVKSIPKLIKAAGAGSLKEALTDHLEVTKGHVMRVEEVFDMLGLKAQAKKCEAMEGLGKEAEGLIEDTEAGTATRDAGLIMAAQKVEHYEIATYGGLATLAKTMGLEDAAAVLAGILEEEKEADEKLTEIAENDINMQAANEEGEEDESEEETEEEDEDEEE